MKKGPQVTNENQKAYLANWKEPDLVGEEEEAFCGWRRKLYEGNRCCGLKKVLLQFCLVIYTLKTFKDFFKNLLHFPLS